jgi:hypothetical protein
MFIGVKFKSSTWMKKRWEVSMGQMRRIPVSDNSCEGAVGN